ncbi:hypothetical protein C4571_03385 [Candidatus Parcubacteria bacterium]|nr:MAG: hypothetical protein C4571_03385 [Candidatus Parcubacteria bacterium]
MIKQIFRLLCALACAAIVSIPIASAILATGLNLHSRYLTLNTADGRPSLGLATFMDVAAPLTSSIGRIPESPIQWAAVIASLVAFVATLWLLWKAYGRTIILPLAEKIWKKDRYLHSGGW